MTYSIAFAGKGGVGKTSVCGMLIDHLARHGKGPVLAVDGDANSNLNEVLGVKVETTLGDIREDIARGDACGESSIPAGMTKKDYADYKFGDALVEEDSFDLLVMGRGQGMGCYCFVNDLLRDQIEKYYKNYNYLVVDNEAGLEHISRGVLPAVDMILLVSDCSRRGIQAAGRLAAMIKELKLKVKDTFLIVNRAPGGVLNDGISEEISDQGLNLIGVLPQNDMIFDYDSAGKPLVSLPEDNPVKKALAGIIDKLKLP
jgi:CO dehydrogenase maturation factor